MNDDRRATRWRARDEPCLNCGDSTPGRYCPTCGQRKTEVLLSVRTLLADVLEDQLVLNRALPRTLSTLLFHPGKLTEEYIRGRVVRYIAPFRLYLVSSVVFFLLMSFVGLRTLEVESDGMPGGNIPPDSAVAADVQDILEGIDTAGLPPSARAALDSAAAVVAAAADSATGTPAARNAAGNAAVDTDGLQDTTVFSDMMGADTALAPGVMQPWAQTLSVQTEWPLFQRAVQRKVAQVGHLPPRRALREVLLDLLEYAPHMVFLLLPLFAFLLKLLYIRRDRYYVEHFVFALHVHAFVFVMFTVMLILPWEQFDGLLFLWIMVYIWIALRRVYRQGWVRTTVKWWTLGWMYFWLLLIGLIGLAVVTLLFT